MADAPRKPRRRIPVAQLNVTLMTAIVFYLYFGVEFNAGRLIPSEESDWRGFFAALSPTAFAASVFLGWFVFQVLLERFLPAKIAEGTPLPDGSRLHYRINGLAAMGVSLAAVGLGYAGGWLDLARVFDEFGALISVATIFAFALSLFLWWWGRTHPGGPSKVSGNFMRDYFYGTALNPRTPPVTGFDWKFFCECRPGLIGWIVLDLACAAAQYERHGEVSLAMLAVILLQTAYVLNNFKNEPWLLTTIDIQSERFGWMLIFGDLVLVPMTYCLQAYWLVDNFREPSPYHIGAVLLLGIVGFVIFVDSNLQKNRFRRDPDGCTIWGKPVESLETQRGTRLLLSGYWGMARHVNYLGDWMIALSFGLCAGFGSLIPYFYPFWFAFLLFTRERRDDRWCAKKYGADWERYKERVPSRIIPGIY
jgi:protein-S-isoprenylcysteine O-methyltransferase Ste14